MGDVLRPAALRRGREGTGERNEPAGVYRIEGEELAGPDGTMHGDIGALAICPALGPARYDSKVNRAMTKLWAVYRTADHGARQVLVLTQCADAARDTTDDPEGDGEGNGDAIDAEPRGSIPNVQYSRKGV